MRSGWNGLECNDLRCKMVVDEYMVEQMFVFDEMGFVEGLFWNQFRDLTKNMR
jgi:hypothetical protein